MSRRAWLRRALAAGLFLSAALAAPAVLVAPAAWAQGAGDQLIAAKTAGMIGERTDGLVGAVGSAPSADVLALVSQVNQERRAQYAKIGAQNSIAADQVALVAGRELIERTPAGQYVQSASGAWVKK